jgi:hypothetical protein
MEHLHTVDHKALHVWARPAIRQLAAVIGFAAYAAAGWVLLTHMLSGREETLATPQRIEPPTTRVTITIDVIDAPTLYCATSADRTASDTILVAAREVPELFWKLGCWEPSDS